MSEFVWCQRVCVVVACMNLCACACASAKDRAVCAQCITHALTPQRDRLEPNKGILVLFLALPLCLLVIDLLPRHPLPPDSASTRALSLGRTEHTEPNGPPSPIFAFLREEFAEGCPKRRGEQGASKAKMSTRARRTLPPRTPVKGSVGSPSLAETAAKGGRKGERNVVECTEEDAGTTNQYEAARLVSPQPSMSRLASQARMAHHSCPFAQNHEPLTLSVPAG